MEQNENIDVYNFSAVVAGTRCLSGLQSINYQLRYEVCAYTDLNQILSMVSLQFLGFLRILVTEKGMNNPSIFRSK